DRTLVRDVEDARPALDGEPPDHRGKVVGEAGLTALVVDEGELLVLAGEAQDRLHHVPAVEPAHPRRAHDRAPDPPRPALPPTRRRAWTARTPRPGRAGPTRRTVRVSCRRTRSRWTDSRPTRRRGAHPRRRGASRAR